jgi:hypothetical protein
MSSNDNRNKKDEKKPKPSFSGGMPMPANPKNLGLPDDHVKETTRRVGGRSAPAMVAPSMGAMAMPFSLSGAPLSMQRQGFGAMINTAPMKAPLTATQTQSRPKFVWNLSSVPTLPEFHPLERTAVFVPNTPASAIAPRLSVVMRERSIESTYDNDKAKVKCVTTDGVDFRIRLYRGRNHYSHGIIVEVQRRFGSSLHFHSDTKAILDAAEGRTPPSPPASIPNRMALPEVSDDEDDDYDVPPPSGSSSLGMVSKMLSLPGFDAQYLGLQTLSSLVDPERMCPSTARAVSVELLKVDSEVGNKVLTYILSRKTDESSMSLRVMSLGILANSMKASSIVPEFLRAPLRAVLLQDLKESGTHPNTALYAAMCLEYYIRGDQDAMELNEAFDVALQVGESRHYCLMRQAQRCIASIR